MAPIHYEKDAEQKEHEKACNVKYDSRGECMNFSKQELDKAMENKQLVMYDSGVASVASCKKPKSKSRSSVKSQKSQTDMESTSICTGRSGNKPITDKIEAKCYEVKRGITRQPCVSKIWQTGKHCRDDCGSGIVAKRFDIKVSRRHWCKTPLSMYQATVGELGRQILCREKLVTRDVKPEPPCNVCEYILPPCGGYYRRYDCLRPCEEDYAFIKAGKKCYRDRVERYWEPCVTVGQKYKLDVNDYGPHNVALGLKLRRKNNETPCW